VAVLARRSGRSGRRTAGSGSGASSGGVALSGSGGGGGRLRVDDEVDALADGEPTQELARGPGEGGVGLGGLSGAERGATEARS
jgi:hypothetical protein